MKTRIIAFALTLALMMSLTACGSNTSSGAATTTTPMESNTPVPPVPETSETESSTAISTTDSTNYAEQEDVTENIEIKYPITGVFQGYSEGRIWVQYLSDGGQQFGLIDDAGRLLYSADTPGGVVQSGFTYITSDSGFTIIDKSGKETYKYNGSNSSDGVYTLVAQGDDIFLLIKQVSGFSDNSNYLCAIDGYGNQLTDELYYEKSTATDFVYMGEGIFTSKSYVFNTNANTLFGNLNKPISSSWDYFTEFYDSTALVGMSLYPSYPCPITPENLASQEAYEEWKDNKEKIEAENSGSQILYTYGEGLVSFYWSLDYYDYHGTFVVSAPDYPSGVEMMGRGWFSGGVAPIVLKGADGFFYATIIDRNGNQQYEPQKLDYQDTSSYSRPQFSRTIERSSQKTMWFSNGILAYMGDSGLKIIDQLGSEREINYNYGTFIGIDDDFMYFDTGIVKLDRTESVDAVIATAGANGNIADSSGLAIEKTYTNPTSFDITGKWKNVGSYGFGQAQPNAIVAFDGTNCNFFSPQDTYAFYKDGDNYRLDCTSFMSTATTSFIMKIVDNNNIDVYYGDSITELKRVE